MPQSKEDAPKKKKGKCQTRTNWKGIPEWPTEGDLSIKMNTKSNGIKHAEF